MTPADFSLESLASMPKEELQRMPASAFAALPEAQLRELMEQTFRTLSTARKENAIFYYEPASPEARKIHLSTAKEVLATGGNRSGKSESVLAEAAIQMTGVIPRSLQDSYPREKIRCPMRVRLNVISITNKWETVIKPKLQWSKWSGREPIGGNNGHWGWIPPRFLKKGSWDESWSAQNRILTLTCGCTMQVMSYEHSVEDLQGDSLHLILNDEGPPAAHYRENKIRTADVAGRILTAMTPPDDESASWDAAWIYDELYLRGLTGPAKDPDIDAFQLFTDQNRILDMVEVEKAMKNLTPEQRAVRGRGEFMHLGGRIYPIYTNRPQMWCFTCNKSALAAAGMCATCGGNDLTEFCHLVAPFDKAYGWPVVYLLDPHPRKPYMMAWFAFAPYGDIFEIGEMECDLDPAELKTRVDDYEREAGLRVMKRIIDPNMAESPAHNAGRRHVTVRDELDAVGLRCDLGMDDFAVGKTRVKTLLTPNPRTRRPTLHVFTTCARTDYQMMRYSWQEWSRYSADTKDPKAVPMDKNSDFPTLIKYLANAEPTYAGLVHGGMPMQRRTSAGRRMGY